MRDEKLVAEQWVEESGLTQRDAAPLFGVCQGQLSKLFAGDKDPSAKVIRKAYRISDGKITPDSWFPELFAESPTN